MHLLYKSSFQVNIPQAGVYENIDTLKYQNI